jgi:hypothetical protein
MPVFRYAGIPDAIAAQVRASMCAPTYGHIAHREVATGYGPCRFCLDTFEVGKEDRILFTYQPINEAAGLPAPGPVFIHAEACERYDGLTFPPAFRGLPIVVEGLAGCGWIVAEERVEAVIARAFAEPRVAYVHLRNGEAGCFMAKVERCFACEPGDP